MHDMNIVFSSSLGSFNVNEKHLQIDLEHLEVFLFTFILNIGTKCNMKTRRLCCLLVQLLIKSCIWKKGWCAFSYSLIGPFLKRQISLIRCALTSNIFGSFLSGSYNNKLPFFYEPFCFTQNMTKNSKKYVFFEAAIHC